MSRAAAAVFIPFDTRVIYSVPSTAMPAYTACDGALLHYDERGSGDCDRAAPPLIALAGGPARHPDYFGDLAGLADRHRLIVPHLRGVGRSPLPDALDRASFWRQAEDIEQLRAHLGVPRAVLIGHSAGTRVAISHALQFPVRVAGMVLVAPPAGKLVDDPSDTEALIDRRRGDPVFDHAIAVRRDGDEIADDAAYGAWMSRMAPVGYAAWNPPEQAHAATAQYRVAAARAFLAAPPSDLAARLGQVTAPVLIIAGADDCITGVTRPLALARRFAAGRAAVIEHCGHYPWVEQPAAFRGAVDEFLVALSHG